MKKGIGIAFSRANNGLCRGLSPPSLFSIAGTVKTCRGNEAREVLYPVMSNNIFYWKIIHTAADNSYAKSSSYGQEFEKQQLLVMKSFPSTRHFRPFLVFYRASYIMAEVTMLSVWHLLLTDIQKRAVKLRRCLIRLGPFYIKLGQALSTRPDILPNAYCQELAKLQDQIPPFPTSQAFKYIESQLGSPVGNLFAEITPKPVAAASLGQVYKAWLHSGEAVAVKVQRPGMPLRLSLDAYLFQMVGGQLQRFLGARRDIVVALNEMIVQMFDEIDYTREGHNADRFAALYGIRKSFKSELGSMAKPDQSTFKTGKGKERMQFVKDSGDSEGMVKVPKVYWNLSSKGVLTMEWIDGIKLTDKEALQKANLDARKLINQGVFCSLRQLLEEGFFHADPHPGNLVATKDGALAYFDFGMMGEFPRHYRIGFIRTLIHFVNRDSLGLASDFNYLGLTPKGTNMKLVAAALQKTFGNENSKSPLDFQGIMNQLSNVMYDFNFTLPPEFALVIRAMGSLEGTAKVLDQDFKVVASAYPFIIGRLLSDPDSDMRHILRELLIRHNGSIRWHRLERLVMAIAAQSFSTHSQAENSIGGSSNNAEDGFHKASLFDVRAVVSATDDLLRFIFSEQGLRVRVLLVQDLVKALDSFLDQEIATSFEPRSKPGKEEKRANSKQNDGNLNSNGTQRDNRSQRSQNKERSRHNSTEKEGNTENVEEILYTKSRVLAGIRTFANTVGSAPELWIPLFISFALKPEAQALFLDILSSFSRTTYQSASEAFWLSLSRILHDSSL